MLTFEYDPEHQIIHVFADQEGLGTLQQEISHLLAGSSHTHLMTPSWAGNELTENKHLEHTILVHQVNVNTV